MLAPGLKVLTHAKTQKLKERQECHDIMAYILLYRIAFKKTIYFNGCSGNTIFNQPLSIFLWTAYFKVGKNTPEPL